MTKSDFTNGVWRTIGGKRIFIRDGESLTSAMKTSGKFKSAKKSGLSKKDEDDIKKKMQEIANQYEKDKQEGKVAERLKSFEDQERNERLQAKEKYMNISQEERVKAYEEGKNWKDLVKEKDAYSNNPDERPIPDERGGRIDPRTGERFFGKTKKEEEYERRIQDGKEIHDTFRQMDAREMKAFAEKNPESIKKMQEYTKSESIKSQQSDIEKASGLKVKRAFESDDFGNGKEDRFQLEDGRFISHSKESLGAKDDTWSINKVENGSIKSQDFKSYEEMKAHLSNESRLNQIRTENQNWRNNFNNTNYSQKQLDDVYKKEDYSEVVSGLKNSELNKMRQAAHDINTTTPGTPGHKNAKEYLQKMENKAAAQFLDRQKSVANKVASHKAYKNAFQEYKKKHPNTKLNLQRFIDMSEGK